ALGQVLEIMGHGGHDHDVEIAAVVGRHHVGRIPPDALQVMVVEPDSHQPAPTPRPVALDDVGPGTVAPTGEHHQNRVPDSPHTSEDEGNDDGQLRQEVSFVAGKFYTPGRGWQEPNCPAPWKGTSDSLGHR